MKRRGKQLRLGAALLAFAAATAWSMMAAGAADKGSDDADKTESGDSGPKDKAPDGKFEPFKPEAKTSTGTVTIGGQAIAYQAIAGTLIVHPKGWDDVPRDPKAERSTGRGRRRRQESDAPKPRCSMSPTSRSGGGSRPVTFLYNGGPGSATVWLHMGAFGPRRDRHRDRRAYTRGSLLAGQQRLEPARCDRSRLHRCAGHGLQPHCRQGQGKGVLRRRSRRLRVRRIHLRSFCPSTGAGIHRSICSARATERRARPCSSISSSRTAPSISTA